MNLERRFECLLSSNKIVYNDYSPLHKNGSITPFQEQSNRFI